VSIHSHTDREAAFAELRTRQSAEAEDRRRAEGKLTRSEAMAWFVGRGVGRNRAYAITGELAAVGCGPANADGMTYDGTYWVVPAEQG
jgi:hypothetical protein